MKTTMKLATLAVIAILTALACTPETALTSRDFTEIRDAKNPKYTNASNSPPSVTANSRPTYVPAPGATTEMQKELSFDFPNSADILSGDITTAGLKRFMSLYTFSNGTSEYTELSVKEDDLDFEFVRRARTASNSAEAVVIKLANVPDKTFVVKIDATAYTFAWGNKMDTNNDGIAGEAYYDDLYFTVTPSGAANTGSYTHPGSLNFQLNIVTGFDTVAGNNANTLSAQNIIVANLSLGGFSSANRKDQQENVLTEIKDMNKIKLQRYDPNAKIWVDTGALVRLETDPDVDWYLVVTVAPQDGEIYRTYASGMRNLTTTTEFLGIKQKIRVLGSSMYGTPTATFRDDVVISEPVFFSHLNRRPQTATPINSAIPVRVMADANGKNVKLEIFFNSIQIIITDTTNTYWLKELDIGTFNNSFKLAYSRTNPSNQITLSSATKWDDIVFIPVKDVVYSEDAQTATAQSGKNKITVTLDPSYQISANRDRAINLFLSPGFQYENELITFGEYSINGFGNNINGVGFWRSYGRIPDGANAYLRL